MLTDPVKPLSGVTPIESDPLPPAGTLSDNGVAVRAKSGPARIVIVSGAVLVPAMFGAVAVNETAYVPGAAPGDDVITTDCEPPAGSANEAGANVTPGTVGAMTFAVPVNPLIPVAVTTTVAVSLGAMVTDAGEAAIEKSGASAIVIGTKTLFAPEAPLKVN
jgi:hypothetical protein